MLLQKHSTVVNETKHTIYYRIVIIGLGGNSERITGTNATKAISKADKDAILSERPGY